MDETNANGDGNVELGVNSLDGKIVRQMEYYFGDYNLRRDKFLQETMKADDGWIKLDTLLTFNRLKNLSTDKDVIVQALKKSPNQLIEISEDGCKLRRSKVKPLPETSEELNLRKETRSVYAKGFPLDTPLDDILEFFEQHGKIENVYMRRFRTDKKFKGSVFALFQSLEEADNFVKIKEVSFKGKPLATETSKAYHERKLLESKKAKAKNKDKDSENKSNENDEKESGTDNPEPIKKGCIMHLNGFKTNTSREDIKEVFDNFAKVAWVDFSRGDTEAWVRFEEGTAAIALQKAKDNNDGKVEICSAELETDILEGEAEIAYWKKIRELSQKRKDRGNQRRGGRGGNARGRGRGGRGGRRHSGRKNKDNSDAEDGDDDSQSVKPTITKFSSDTEEPSEKMSEPESKKHKLDGGDSAPTEPPAKVSKVSGVAD